MMTGFSGEPRVAARGIVLDDDGRYVLIRRVRTDGERYLVTPGGGVEAGEASAETLRRECAEELGAEVRIGEVVWVGYHAVPEPGGLQRFLLCRLVSINDRARTGHEFDEPKRGSYETVRVAPDDAALADLRPAELVALLQTHHRYFRSEAAWL